MHKPCHNTQWRASPPSQSVLRDRKPLVSPIIAPAQRCVVGQRSVIQEVVQLLSLSLLINSNLRGTFPFRKHNLRKLLSLNAPKSHEQAHKNGLSQTCRCRKAHQWNIQAHVVGFCRTRKMEVNDAQLHLHNSLTCCRDRSHWGHHAEETCGNEGGQETGRVTTACFLSRPQQHCDSMREGEGEA